MKSYEIEELRWREGLAEGKTAGLAEAVLDLLGCLGDVPSSLQETIMTQKDDTTLRAWLKLAAKADSIEDFTKQI